MVEIRRGTAVTTVAEDERLDVDTLFAPLGADAPLIVEIGTGTGDQICHAAAAAPHTRFLAFEVWRPGVAQTVAKARDAGLRNLRIVEADAEQCLRFLLPEASADEVWTFFPDPWRKRRHHKRRLVKPSFASDVARLLIDGGPWRLATDWRSYASQMIAVLAAHEEFDLYNRGRYEGRILTKFEQRAIDEGRFPYDLTAVRRPRA
ncbi:MAG: tRNA (guanosine(46)-N7)-methyltransferase TrmB [Bowdeniella nasicola]|nr:tRNA (guanosine(46)-N7)-methyltransferase TrmB [Bowdeniella nasicola]